MTDVLKIMLHQTSQSLTKPRLAVFESLQGQPPLSMSELITRCSFVDRASVYRTITLFETMGIVTRIQSGWKYKIELSDSFSEHHHHATCVRCGYSIALPEDKALENQLTQLAARHNFIIEKHLLELQGVCSMCTVKNV